MENYAMGPNWLEATNLQVQVLNYWKCYCEGETFYRHTRFSTLCYLKVNCFNTKWKCTHIQRINSKYWYIGPGIEEPVQRSGFLVKLWKFLKNGS